MADWIFVAPHLDDVVLSCGGAVAKAARTGSPVIATVFAGKPEGELSEFARFQHERWELNAADGVERRREEDRRAAAKLGNTVATHWLDFLDAIYRDPGYASDDALFGAPVKGDLTLAEEVFRELRKLPTTRYVVPMGVGNHVDHQIVREAGAMLLREGAEVWMYPELPYALKEGALALTLAHVRAGDPISIRLDDDALERKCAAVREYASQLPVLFRGLGDPCEALEDFARKEGGGRPAEIIWRLRPDDDPLLQRRPFVA